MQAKRRYHHETRSFMLREQLHNVESRYRDIV